MFDTLIVNGTTFGLMCNSQNYPIQGMEDSGQKKVLVTFFSFRSQ